MILFALLYRNARGQAQIQNIYLCSHIYLKRVRRQFLAQIHFIWVDTYWDGGVELGPLVETEYF